jgi:hypothetical protein
MTPLVAVTRHGGGVAVTVELSLEQAEAARTILGLAPAGWLRKCGEAISAALEADRAPSDEHRIAAL